MGLRWKNQLSLRQLRTFDQPHKNSRFSKRIATKLDKSHCFHCYGRLPLPFPRIRTHQLTQMKRSESEKSFINIFLPRRYSSWWLSRFCSFCLASTTIWTNWNLKDWGRKTLLNHYHSAQKRANNCLANICWNARRVKSMPSTERTWLDFQEYIPGHLGQNSSLTG